MHLNEHEKLPSLYPPAMKSENQMKKLSLQPSAQSSNQNPQQLDSKMNYLFEKIDQLIFQMSNNDQRLLQLEDFISRNPGSGATNGKVQFSDLFLISPHNSLRSIQ
jgi:TolA-binding protein